MIIKKGISLACDVFSHGASLDSLNSDIRGIAYLVVSPSTISQVLM